MGVAKRSASGNRKGIVPKLCPEHLLLRWQDGCSWRDHEVLMLVRESLDPTGGEKGFLLESLAG